jgi:type I restriction enzyme S subunit
MKVSKGFKQTEIGEIPEDWEQSYLGDLADKIIGGGTPSRSNPTYWGNEIPWVTVKDFSTFVPDSTQEYITYLGLKNSSTSLIPQGNLITSTRMALGKAVIYNVDVAINQDLKAIYLKKDIDRKYIYYWFQANSKKLQDLGSGSTVMGISTADLKSLSLPLPPLKEQQAISEVLSDMDRMISQTEALIEKKKAIKQGMMQELLKPKKAGINAKRKFKQTEIGEIPEDWEVDTIDSVSKIFGRIGFRGYTVNDIVEEGKGAISLSPSNIQDGTLNISKVTYISWYKYEESPEIKVKNGDILLVKTGSTYGKTTIVQGLVDSATVNPQIVILKNITCNALLLSYIIKSPTFQNQINTAVVGGAIPTLSQEKVNKFLIPLPPLKEQQAIADALSGIDINISTLESKLQKLKLQKQGMMQALLTGRIRLT